MKFTKYKKKYGNIDRRKLPIYQWQVTWVVHDDEEVFIREATTEAHNKHEARRNIINCCLSPHDILLDMKVKKVKE